VSEPPAERAAELVARAGALGVRVEPPAAAALLRYLDAMLAENHQVNLTAIREPAQALVLHVLDSLAIGALQPPLAPRRCADVGTGNGFPGIALRVLWPEAEVAWLERTGKKVAALERALRAAAIDGVQLVHVDADQAPRLRPELRGRYDLLAARAVGEPAEVAATCAPLATRDATLVLWLDDDARPNASLPGGFDRAAWHEYELPEPAARRRRLAVYRRRPAR
jgi:16S rRNA (guanine527-N7)-methyltransferase